MNRKKTMTDAVGILHKTFVKGEPSRLASIQEEQDKLDIAGQVFELRTQAGLSQVQLAKLVGTTQSVISRLEAADYAGHSLNMLRRIAGALHCRVEVRFVHEKTRAS